MASVNRVELRNQLPVGLANPHKEANKMGSELLIRVPESLAEKSIKDAVAVGLHYVVIKQKKPKMIPIGKLKTTRIKLSDAAEAYLEQGLKVFSSKRELLIEALAWISEQPPHVRNTKI